jgi:hypothetical protein
MGWPTGPAACTTAPLAGPATPWRLLAPAWAGWARPHTHKGQRTGCARTHTRPALAR